MAMKSLEVCIIKIPFESCKHLFIISAYYPSGNNDMHLQNDLTLLFETLNIENDFTLLHFCRRFKF